MGEILIVDDSKLNRTVLARRFRDTEHQVRLADSGEAGRLAIASQLPDLVILDEMMPGIGGLDLLQELRTRYSLVELPIIMLTARDESARLVEAFQVGANDFITKGADFGEILARVNTHLRLQQFSRLQDEFLWIASHDLKNPIGVIAGAVRLLLANQDLFTAVEKEQMLTAIGQRAAEMKGIVERFLDRAREGAGAALILENFSVTQAVREVVEAQTNYALQKKIALRVSTAANALVYGDRSGLIQVLNNVLGNAIKYSPANSGVAIRCLPLGAQVRIEISDAGPGIPADKLGQVFDKFCQIGNKPTGDETSTGLGMYITRSTLLRMGGDISVVNLPERGCCFSLILPAKKT